MVADQVSKAIVRANISRVEEIDLVLGVKLIHTRNTGVAFSLFSGGGPLIVIIAVVALGALLGVLPHASAPAAGVAADRACSWAARRAT